MQFTLHTKETAPKASVPVLEQTEKDYGFALNLFGIMAESPVALSAYVQINKLLGEHAALSAQEQQVVMLAVSENNQCEYCMAAHSTVGEMVQVPAEAIDALRAGREPEDPRLAALVRFTRSAMDNRGWIPESDQKAFLEAGFTTQHVLDVISILALKTLSNYTNHLAQTPLDDAFAANKWSKGERSK